VNRRYLAKLVNVSVCSDRPGGTHETAFQLYNEEMDETQKQRVLLVEDDRELAYMVAEFLTSHGFEMLIEFRGDLVESRMAADRPDVVILDVNLPGLDGFSVCRQIRGSFSGPILILTARGEEVDEVIGLEVGADDYLTKPVRPHALLARLRVHLRKATSQPVDAADSKIDTGSLVIDQSCRTVELEGQSLDLTTAEFDLLWLLAQNVGKVLSRGVMYQELHGMRYDGIDRSMDLRVSRLRKKLGDDPHNPRRIKSVRGVGYILSVEK